VASHKSALKAHKQSLQNREANRQNRSRLRSTLKTIRQALTAGDAEGVKSQLDQTVSLIDKMAAKGVIHDNAAARYKSRLARRLNGLTAA
jgi:small subunit ribosomal protein S20